MPTVAATRRDTPLRREDGYAIPVVMGIIALLTVITTAGFALAQQSLHDSELNRDESQAFQAANAAADAAVSDLRLRGSAAQFPMIFTGDGVEASVESTSLADEYQLKSVGRGEDGSTETIRVRVFVMRLYGMNIAYGSGFNQNTGGMFNGNASIYGPFYTYDSLRQGENLGQSLSGGFGWGPIYINGGTLDVREGYLRDVSDIFVDAKQPDPKIVTPPTNVVRSVPDLDVPQVDTAFLTDAYSQAREQSTDNIQGDPVQRPDARNDEPTTYPDMGALGNYPGYYKVVDKDTTMNGSLSAGLTIGTGVSFGRSTDDFAWNDATRELTVWGTVFIDGPLTLTGGAISYVGNGALIVNGPVKVDCSFTPKGGLGPGITEDGPLRNGLPNQRFVFGETVGIATPRTISLQASTSSNSEFNPSGLPTHAGAFFADERITFKSKTVVVGSLISRGLDVLNNNNMDLRTSPNLGECVSRSMPGVDVEFVSIGLWARQ